MSQAATILSKATGTTIRACIHLGGLAPCLHPYIQAGTRRLTQAWRNRQPMAS
jgi:hypothetical protein